MKKFWLAVASVALLMTGCNDDKDVQSEVSDVSPEIVDVKILTPEQVKAQELVLLEAQVTQGDEFVNDADNVTFEVWESGMREQGKMLDGDLTEDGKYSVNYTFDHDGVYYVYAHTNARGLHIMPKQQITVGSPDMSKVLPDDSSNTMEHMEEHGESNHSKADEANSHGQH